MAIQPIDLQTLFTQIDKVGKDQMNQKEGVHLQAALQGVQIQKKTDERDHSVNETRDTGEGAEQIKDRNARQGGGEYPSGRQPGEKDPGEDGDRESPFIWDPALGKNIDISG